MVILDGDRIVFTDQFKASMVNGFLACVEQWIVERHRRIVLDFSASSAAWPDSMVPVLATADWLRSNGVDVATRLPRETELERLFTQASWAHHLEPTRFAASTADIEHFNARRFRDAEEQQVVVNEFMRLIVGTLSPPKDVLTAIEWSINEITDNVLTHAESQAGGLIQILSLPNPAGVVFCVADSGRGILASMREGHPKLTVTGSNRRRDQGGRHA